MSKRKTKAQLTAELERALERQRQFALQAELQQQRITLMKAALHAAKAGLLSPDSYWRESALGCIDQALDTNGRSRVRVLLNGRKRLTLSPAKSLIARGLSPR